MKSIRILGSLFAACVLVAAAVAADPSGIWTWTTKSPNGDINTTLKLESKAGKLVGAYSNQFGDAQISHASLQGDVIAFEVVRNVNGSEFVLKYRGTLKGDTIKGTISVPGFDGGDPVKLDWNATREPKAKT